MPAFRHLVVCGCCLWPLAVGCAPSGDSASGPATRLSAELRVPVRLAAVRRADLAAEIELVGSLIPRRRSVIVAEVDGVIKDLANIEEIPDAVRGHFDALVAEGLIDEPPSLNLGTPVRQGQPIVWLDDTQYRLKLAIAEAHLQSARRALENLLSWRREEEIQQAQAACEEESARAAAAEAEFERAKQLVGQAALARSRYDQLEAAYKTAVAAKQRAEAELALATAGPTKEERAVAEAAVAQAQAEVNRAQWELDKTVIVAPYDGVVTDRYVDVGERVTALPRVEIMEILDLSFVSAQLAVPERHIGQFQIGDLANVFVKGSVAPVPGLIALVNDKVDPTSRTFRIRVVIRNDQRRFKAGQFVRVALQVQSAANAVTVPLDAITYTGGESHVFVYQNGRVHQRQVTLGISSEDFAEVLDGLAEGEQVVVDDPSILSDDMAVDITTDELASQTTAQAR